jgi:uncharacterized C2H2 Zn-finger protein
LVIRLSFVKSVMMKCLDSCYVICADIITLLTKESRMTMVHINKLHMYNIEMREGMGQRLKKYGG